MLDYNSSLTALTLLLTVLIFCRSVSLRKRAAVQSALLAEFKNKLKTNEEEKSRELDFQTNLQQAEITTKLQKSRSSVVHNRPDQRANHLFWYT